MQSKKEILVLPEKYPIGIIPDRTILIIGPGSLPDSYPFLKKGNVILLLRRTAITHGGTYIPIGEVRIIHIERKRISDLDPSLIICALHIGRASEITGISRNKRKRFDIGEIHGYLCRFMHEIWHEETVIDESSEVTFIEVRAV